MAPIIPDPKKIKKIKSFRTEAAFDRWMRANQTRAPKLWLRIYKKGSGVPTITNAQALDVALCWGWIDGIRKAFDERRATRDATAIRQRRSTQTSTL